MSKDSSSLKIYVSKDWALNFCLANFCCGSAMWWLQWEKVINPKISQTCIQTITESNSKRSLIILTKMSKPQLQSVFLCVNFSVQPTGPRKDCYGYYCI